MTRHKIRDFSLHSIVNLANFHPIMLSELIYENFKDFVKFFNPPIETYQAGENK